MIRLRISHVAIAVACAITSLPDFAVGAGRQGRLAEASKAMGVDSLNTVEYSATGFDFVFGQAYNPSSPWPKFINKSYTRVIDFQDPCIEGRSHPHAGREPAARRRPAAGHR